MSNIITIPSTLNNEFASGSTVINICADNAKANPLLPIADTDFKSGTLPYAVYNRFLHLWEGGIRSDASFSKKGGEHEITIKVREDGEEVKKTFSLKKATAQQCQAWLKQNSKWSKAMGAAFNKQKRGRAATGEAMAVVVSSMQMTKYTTTKDKHGQVRTVIRGFNNCKVEEEKKEEEASE